MWFFKNDKEYSHVPGKVMFAGECHAIILRQRREDDPHIVVEVWTEDDGQWFHRDGLDYSSYWHEELIQLMQQTMEYLKTQEPDVVDGVQYGWKFKEN